MTSTAAVTAIPTSTATTVWPASRPKTDPKSTAVPAALFPVARSVVKMDRNSTPRPSTQAKTLPMTTSSARARGPSRPSNRATPTVATNSPRRRSNPKAKAARAPVKATCDRASPVKTWPRSTTK